ncbi:MAG: hypothetical protein H8E89_11420 [Candidatus Nitrosopelagicus sp.]|nr:hypothetical protein [Candidatus Nitrosopelagicus sp.]MDC4231809.1 hypothetical protein [Nitrosopumilus sp.]
MHHTEHDSLTEYEYWIVEELVKYGTEDTNHLTNYCFDRQYNLSEKGSISATKLFYSSLFNKPVDARYAIDRILEIPFEYQVNSLLHLGHSLAILYKHMIEHDPSLDEKMKEVYAKWVEGLIEKDGEIV